MSADNRSTHTDALATLGTIITPAEKRDAIHLAAFPVQAAHRLLAGMHIGLKDGKADREALVQLGIVDPFITVEVQPGEWCWLIVYPRQITSLRHVWEHPGFPASGETDGAAPAAPAMNPSEKWIRDFADSIPLAFDTLMEGADDWVHSKRKGRYGEYLCFGGLLEGESVPDAFWPHYEVVRGTQVEEEHRGSFFTCSC